MATGIPRTNPEINVRAIGSPIQALSVLALELQLPIHPYFISYKYQKENRRNRGKKSHIT
jgi:hypothetical protein